VSEETEELKKIRAELQWLTWGLVKIPLIGLVIFLVFQVLTGGSGAPEEPIPVGPATSLDKVCRETNDGRLAVEVGQRTLYIDTPASYQKLSPEEKWKLWDNNGDGTATTEEIEAGISELQASEKK
jgi:hypothetical protein